MSAIVNASIGTVPSTDPAIALMNHLRNNWNGGFVNGPNGSAGGFFFGPGSFVGSTPQMSQIIFDTKYRNVGSRYGCFVKRRSTPLSIDVIGASRQTFNETFDVVLYAKGDNADDVLWQMKERCKSRINANPQALLSYGIEWMWNDSWTILPASQQVAKILSGVADPGQIRLYVGRVTLSYDKVLLPSASPVVPTVPPLKALVLTRLGTGFLENPAKSVADLLYNNWTATDPAKGATQDTGVVTFDTVFRNRGKSLYEIVVRPQSETSSIDSAANPRDRTRNIMLIEIYAKNKDALDKRWKMEQEVIRIINKDMLVLWSKGIEEMYLDSFQINEAESEDDLLHYKASNSYISWATAKLNLVYTYEAV